MIVRSGIRPSEFMVLEFTVAHPLCRVFPGQSVCAYGLNPTGAKFMAQRLVTHVPPPSALGTAVGLGSEVAAAVTTSRAGGMSLVLAAGPYCLADDLSYSPLEDLLSYCTGECVETGCEQSASHFPAFGFCSIAPFPSIAWNCCAS